MKIEKINFNSISQRTLKSSPKVPLVIKKDEVAFMGKNKKRGFFETLKRKIKVSNTPQVACYTLRENSQDLSDEEMKSEEIKEVVGRIIASYGEIKLRGERTISEIKDILYMGRSKNYKEKVKFNLLDNAVASFGDINPDTNLPKNITVWEDGKYSYSYDILSSAPEISYRLTMQRGNVITEQTGTSKTITKLTQKDRSTKAVKQYDKTENGFNYLLGYVKDNGENIKISKRLYFDFSNINGCIYGEADGDEIPLYFYDYENDLWEQRYTIEFDENSAD